MSATVTNPEAAPKASPAEEGPLPARAPATKDVPRAMALQPRRFLRSAILGAALVIAAAVTVPLLFGCRSLIVMSGSMGPTIHTGDVIVDRTISPLDAHIGDVITFRDPENGSVLITHRVRTMEVRNGAVIFTTKGDANNSLERWSVPDDGTVGRVIYRVPRLGYLVVAVRSTWGRLALLVLPSILLGIWALARIWRPRPARVDDVQA
jgi:signal peptidase